MYNPFIGIFKFILSLLVVAIHVEPFTGDVAFFLNNCIARIAVPSFFIYSSYFSFDKLIKSNWDIKIFKSQQLHLTKYYLIWLLLHSPIIVCHVYEESTSIGNFIWLLFQAVCLKGPYGAFWFLPATLMAMTLVYFIGKKTSPLFCVILSFPFFFFTVLEMEYWVFIKDINWMNKLYDIFVAIFGWLANGLTFGFFFCAVGLYIAYTKNKKRNLKIDIALSCISFAILFVECYVIRKYQLGGSYGAMFMLIPTVYYIARVLLNLKTNKDISSVAKYLQNMSLLIYPMHFVIMEGTDWLLRNWETYNNSTALQYLIVTAITCTISIIIIYLGQNKNIKFFRALYGR